MRNKLLYLSLFFIIGGNSFFLPISLKSNEKKTTPRISNSYFKKLPKNDYILGPGDLIRIDFSQNYPELLTEKRIDGEGTIYLPRLKRIYIEGLTINELNKMLNNAYKEFIKYPEAEVSVIEYRVLRVGIRGEVNDPGMHTLKGSISLTEEVGEQTNNFYFPTLFDAIRESGGITEFTDLSNIKIIRKNNLSEGGGQKTTEIDFESIFKSNDISKNIRIYDSDIIILRKLPKGKVSNLRSAISSNLNPKLITVFVSGRVNNPGPLNLPKSTVLNDAIALADSKFLKGKITFIRFKNDGTFDKRKFNYNSRNKRGSFKNPYLNNNDLVMVGNSLLGVTNEVITEVTQPFVGIFSTYGLIKAIKD